ncbi:hypothetical protein IJ847_02455 [Candidatus Saccharibacteria bacterium]|nr:hypothetical protein [Candidatus Saccharibacteria bacterium]
MKNLEPEVLANLSAEDIVNGLCEGDFSVVKSLGCKKLLRGVGFGRLGAGLALRLSRLGKRNASPSELRKSLSCFLKKFTPYDTPQPSADVHETGAVMAFNHPSLGEIPRLIIYCLERYPQKQLLFPVTLVWFEALASHCKELEKLGVTITPTITPNAVAELQEIAPQYHAEINEIRTKLNNRYLSMTEATLRKGGIVLVAPNATREVFLFENEAQMRGDEAFAPETLSLLAISLSRHKDLTYEIIPMAIAPPVLWSRGINLFNDYDIIPCENITNDEALAMARHKVGKARVRELDLYFRKAIADVLREYGEDLVMRPEHVSDVVDPWTYDDE